MENPEEVLQALDEFQKMRPSEIPRELEEYLSWVAKTGDPVYQWSLVKPLFREKLTRVMTDFYESCPSLDLTPCPNVDQFNYDNMKCNLLELLESFANAPFTVQRICELLTSPRKEYNRVDKFMRAMEKNILVVSTIEPGPAARRSENGEGMVNGSLEEELPDTQPLHEVEMESWVKDCTSDTTVAVVGEDGENCSPESVVPVVKTKITITEEIPHIRKEEDTDESTNITDNEEISQDLPVDNVVPSTEESTNEAASRLEDMSGNGVETAPAMVPAEVPEAVMNEDTSSQPSLDAEIEATESSTTRKLQTTFRTKDFVKKLEKSVKSYAEVTKNETEKRRIEDDDTEEEQRKVTSIESREDTTLRMTSEEAKLSFVCQEITNPDGMPEKRARIDSLINDLEINENTRTAENNDVSSIKKVCTVVEEKTEVSESFAIASIVTKSAEEEIEEKTSEDTRESSEERLLSSCEKIGDEKKKEEEEERVMEETKKEEITESADDSLPEAERTSEVTSEDSRPIVEEPSFDETTEENRDTTLPMSEEQQKQQQEDSGVTIEEAMEDDTRINKSIVPDPIPIVEEPKDVETPKRDNSSTTIITEMTEITGNTSIITETQVTEDDEVSRTVVEKVTSIETTLIERSVIEKTSTPTVDEEVAKIEEICQDDITDVRCPEEETIEEKIETEESMEIDGEETLPVVQQDEPMEQEPGDMVKS